MIFVFLNLIIILSLMFTIGRISIILHERKYTYRHTIIEFFKGNQKPIEWYRSNSFYFWFSILRLAMLGTALTMIGQFMHDNIFVRPPFIFVCSAILWITFFFGLTSIWKKVKKSGALK